MSQEQIRNTISCKRVIEKLKPSFPENLEFIEINQQERKMLFKNTDGLYQVWAYSYHFKEKLDSYHVTGSTHHIMRDIREIFNNPNYLKDSDKAMYEN
jgi:hypothetical protein